MTSSGNTMKPTGIKDFNVAKYRNKLNEVEVCVFILMLGVCFLCYQVVMLQIQVGDIKNWQNNAGKAIMYLRMKQAPKSILLVPPESREILI